jgi:hypothetical protein
MTLCLALRRYFKAVRLQRVLVALAQATSGKDMGAQVESSLGKELISPGTLLFSQTTGTPERGVAYSICGGKPQRLRTPEVERFDQIAGTHMGADAEV